VKVIPLFFTLRDILMRANELQLPIVGNSWLIDLIEWDCNSVAYFAICCVSAAFYARITPSIVHPKYELIPLGGVHDGIQADMKSAAMYYERALRQLSANIDSRETRLHDANVATAFLLSIYEVSQMAMSFSQS
jgi:hypothetical protein